MFESMVWKEDRMLWSNLVFRLQEQLNENWELGDNCFVLHKSKRIMDEYSRLWRSRAGFRPRNILELGIWDGGSIALWFEYFQPNKCVAIDIKQRADSKYFRDYVTTRGLDKRIKTYWTTNQSDRVKLREIVDQDFVGCLDLVIDDASHQYGPTKASFELLFPLITPGGLYIIEDWSWACWSGLPVGFLPVGTELPKLIFQLVLATGSMEKWLTGTGPLQTLKSLIADVTVFPDFVVVERGSADAIAFGEFDLESYITSSQQLTASSSDLR